MPDFFLDDFTEEAQSEIVERQTIQSAAKQESAAPAAAPAPAQGSGPIMDVFKELEPHMNEEMVNKTNAVFAFSIKDDKSEWFLDLKNGAGSCGPGQAPSQADVTFTLKSADFGKMFSGKLKPTTAFMTGKLKIAGNMGKAMALEKMMAKMQKGRSYSTSTNNMWIPKSKL